MNEKSGTTVTPEDRERFAARADELVRAFAESATGNPVLPPHRREELVRLLARSMADRETLDAYIEELDRARAERGVDLALLERPRGDLSEEAIAKGGFGVVPDEQLAEIAIDPSALRALAAYLWRELDPDSEEPAPEWGDWWWQAVTSEDLARPAVVARVIERVRGEIHPVAKEERVIPFDPARTARRPRATRWLGQVAAIAASLLLGVFLGRTAFDGVGEGGGRYPLASASPVYGPGRGTERDLGVRFESGLPGFATIVALAPGSRPEVFPALGRDDLPVKASVPTDFGPLPSGTREALVIVTETPAADPIRRVLRERDDGTGDVSVIRSFLESHLRTKGYRRVASGSMRFDAE